MWLWMLGCASVPPDHDGDHFLGPADGGHDCDDGDSSIFPGAFEVLCDGVDQDCDGDVGTGYADADGDVHGDPNRACPPDGDLSASPDDCNDSDPDVRPGAVEACNGVDDDCDGVVDDGAVLDRPFYLDRDEDGYGDAASPTTDCAAQASPISGDCDDGNRRISPAEAEVCADGIDQDCNDEDDACPPFHLADNVYHVKANLGPTICAGDLDGNGDTELVFGTGYSAAGDGGWWLFDGLDTEASFWFQGREGLGGPCAIADLDDDGADELVLLASDASYLVHGQPGLLSSETLRDGLWDNAEELAAGTGAFVGGAALSGDIDGDRAPDLLVGTSGARPGVVYGLHDWPGADDGLADAAWLVLSGGRADQGFGASLGLFDWDADGSNDVAVGDPENGDGTARIFVFDLPATGALDEADARVSLSTTRDYGFAEQISAGDLYGDGHGAIVSMRGGSAVVVPGSAIVGLSGEVSLDTVVGSTIAGPPALGAAMAIGDFDQDGTADFTITAVKDEESDGRAYLFLGPLATGGIDTSMASFSVIGEEGSGLGVSSAIVHWPDEEGSLWLVGALSGQMYGFAPH